MKDISLYLLKNAFGAKMKKGFRNFCHGDSSTSTLDQQKMDPPSTGSKVAARPLVTSPVHFHSQPTLEEMILQLELEEKMGRKDDGEVIQHRMSCVNSSDILRTARNALNQYPRFSLDGKDAMYRSSFTNLAPAVHGSRKKGVEPGQTRRLPAEIAGESVAWCKPGVVAKLMGLEAMPIPLNSNVYKRQRLSAIIRQQNLRSRVERHDMERRMDSNGGRVGSCSRTGYCYMKPLDDQLEKYAGGDRFGWPMKHFV